MNKIEIALNGQQVILDVDRARELGLIENVNKELIDRLNDSNKYYYIESIGLIDTTENWNSLSDKGRLSNGNYFSSREVAQSHIDQLGGLTARINTYLLEANAKSNWKADWNDSNQYKYHIFFDYTTREYRCSYFTYTGAVGVIYTSKEIVEELVDKLNSGWR